MKNKSVAVLDIRSSELCAVVGERGVNHTFIIKSKFACAYEGYAEGELLDIGSFNRALADVVKSTLSAATGKIRSFYVGVPDEFIRVVNTDKVLSFSAPVRIGEKHLVNLAASSLPSCEKGYTVIKNSPQYYVLSDKRRMINPVGAVSDSLRGLLSYFLCRSAFIECLINAFKPFENIADLNLIPQCYAQAMYLVEPELRDGYAVLFDMGYISSSYSVICGNGVAFNESFSVGTGHVALLLSSELGIPYGAAREFLGKINLNAKGGIVSVAEAEYEGKTYSFPASTLRDIIKEGLDGICETVEECRQAYTGKNLNGKTLFVTGEGIRTIRGAEEHISSRLVSGVEIVAPKVPYYDKPVFSSLFSLLNAALND